MNEIVLKSIVYEYYPKRIDSIKEREIYNNSKEFQKLLSLINNFYSVNQEKLDLIKEEFDKFSLTKNFQNVSSLSFDRCLTYELDIYDDSIGVVFKIRIVISILIPYFFIYVLENKIQLNPYKQLTLPNRNKEIETSKFKNEINLISSIVKKIFGFDLFPEKYLDLVIPDISHSDIREGNFTFFNAFFRGENLSLI